jgi:hypothetical protein
MVSLSLAGMYPTNRSAAATVAGLRVRGIASPAPTARFARLEPTVYMRGLPGSWDGMSESNQRGARRWAAPPPMSIAESRAAAAWLGAGLVGSVLPVVIWM